MISWIKVETVLPHKPEVAQIALRLRIGKQEAIGLCVSFWCWLDSATTDGNLKDFDAALLDDAMGRPGFAEAMVSVGWLSRTPRGLAVPNFERHNGTNSKRRALDARRAANYRDRRRDNAAGK